MSNLSTLRANGLIYINWALLRTRHAGQGLSLAMLTPLPTIADLDLGALYRRPHAMGGLFLAILAGTRSKKGFAVNILRVRRPV